DRRALRARGDLRVQRGRVQLRGARRDRRVLRKSMGRETFLSSHKAHHPEITLTGPDTASGIWALEDWVVDTQWELDIRGAAFYEDDYVKRDGEWKIPRTAYKRVLEELSPRSGRSGLQLTASYWGTGGRSSLPAPD